MSNPFGAVVQEPPQTAVELRVSARNLPNKDVASKSDPVCVLFLSNFGTDGFLPTDEVGRTECVRNSLEPAWAHAFSLQYRFEERQRLRFDIYDLDSASDALQDHDFLGRADVTLAEIVGAPGSRLEKKLTKGGNGIITITADIVEGPKEMGVMQWSGEKLDKKDFLGKSDPFLVLLRINEDRTTTVVHRTDYVKNTLNPTWLGFQIPLRSLCRGQKERPFRMDCYDYDKDGGHDLIGSVDTTIAALSAVPPPTLPLINPKKAAKKKGYTNSGTLRLLSLHLTIQHSFLDFVRSGTQLHFTVAVDFTASNGNPSQAGSLHYIHPSQPNQYMMALKAVGDIIADYDADKMFPALGFGARLPDGSVSHEFFLNFHPSDPHCPGVNGVLDAYRRAVQSVGLYGPTCFTPVINHVARIANQAGLDGRHYFILLIITDGIITDFEQTKAAIVAASVLPMSIIIVGVGSDDFSAMDELDGDGGRLVSADGRRAARDMVQFVPFRQFAPQGPNANPEAVKARLAQEVLKEVPEQLTEWMAGRKIPPASLNRA